MLLQQLAVYKLLSPWLRHHYICKSSGDKLEEEVGVHIGYFTQVKALTAGMHVTVALHECTGHAEAAVVHDP